MHGPTDLCGSIFGPLSPQLSRYACPVHRPLMLPPMLAAFAALVACAGPRQVEYPGPVAVPGPAASDPAPPVVATEPEPKPEPEPTPEPEPESDPTPTPEPEPTPAPEPEPERVPRRPKRYVEKPIDAVMRHAAWTPDPEFAELTVATFDNDTRILGDVKIGFCVGKDGKTHYVEVVRDFRDQPSVGRVGVEMIEKWRFKGFRRDGKPIVVCSIITFDLRAK